MWTIQCDPRPHELLSSWISRFARVNALSPRHALHALWGARAARCDEDVDRLVTAEQLAILSAASGLPISTLESFSLNSFVGQLSGNSVLAATWILSTGTPGHVRIRYGQQACITCLRSEEPYFRREWRLAFVTACHRHDRRLIDRCANCHAHIGVLDGPWQPYEPWRCWRCGRDLEDPCPEPLQADAADLQRLCLSVLEIGCYRAPSRDISCASFFSNLEAVVRRIHSSGAEPSFVPAEKADIPGGRLAMRFHGHLHRLANLSPRERETLFSYVQQRLDRRGLDPARWLFDDGLGRGPNRGRRRRGRSIGPASTAKLLATRRVDEFPGQLPNEASAAALRDGH